MHFDNMLNLKSQLSMQWLICHLSLSNKLFHLKLIVLIKYNGHMIFIELFLLNVTLSFILTREFYNQYLFIPFDFKDSKYFAENV